MLNLSNIHPYQQHCVEHILSNEASCLFLQPGLGKTISTLTAINQMMYEDFEINKVLIVAPKRVAESVWSQEAQLWSHVKHLTFSHILGTEKQRKQSLLKKADIYIINRENVVWLVGYYGTAWPFDCLVLDELSSFKSAKAHRFKALRQIRPRINKVIGLTGTPTSNGLIDLWPQLYLLDQGERLGKTLTGFRDNYFSAGKRNGHIVYEYKAKSHSEQEIYNKIGDICISMKAKDYLDLPGRLERTVPVILHGKTLEKYYDFEKKQILALDNAEDISVINAAALTNKLLQFANGAVYDENKDYHEVHNEKIEALEELVEAANGKPVLVFYTYKHDVERIMKYLKKYKPEKLEGSEHIAKWNRGEVPFLLCHPASAGHGLNMQAGGNIIIWYGLPWSLELFQQANARLDRQGQKEVVIIHRLITKGTMDEDVLKALEGKSAGQDALMEAVKARIQKYIK